MLRPVAELTAGLVLLLVVGAGCSGDGDSDAAFRDQGEVSSAEPTQPPPATDDAEAEAETEEREAGSLGHVSGELPDFSGTSMVPLGLEVTGLRRNGELVELEMTLTVEADDPPPDFRFNIWSYMEDTIDTGGEGFDLSGVRLIDQGGRTAYLPAVDSQGVCLCSNAGSDIAPGESVNLQATFGGLPADIEQVDVHVPGFPPVEQLPIGS